MSQDVAASADMAAVKQDQKLQHVIDQKVAEGRMERAEAETVIAAAAKLERETAAAISLVNATIQKAAMERHEKQAVAEAGRKREEEVDKRDGQVAEVKHSDWLKKRKAVVAAAEVVAAAADVSSVMLLLFLVPLPLH